MVNRLILLMLLIFFSYYLVRLLGLKGKQSISEPLWVVREFGWGVGLNPKHPLGFWLILVLVVTVLLALLLLLVIEM
ncbi:hypothetical protein [Streptococcus saliviloxodontae]|uniref:Uncharacterized protein n=1 Tax=Streptococcus saliviloxodontae TaxID=1349416 RepID=A0ABS2PQN3_9STRE|nr:hypothetical protein [Streptococcus saliviloxodontae]MBM7637078.1 hypothetical protein [Streptococcus saliviloxodontae]